MAESRLIKFFSIFYLESIPNALTVRVLRKHDFIFIHNSKLHGDMLNLDYNEFAQSIQSTISGLSQLPSYERGSAKQTTAPVAPWHHRCEAKGSCGSFNYKMYVKG